MKPVDTISKLTLYVNRNLEEAFTSSWTQGDDGNGSEWLAKRARTQMEENVVEPGLRRGR
jgi:hypothetical protein